MNKINGVLTLLSVLLCIGAVYWLFAWAASQFNSRLDPRIYLAFPLIGMTLSLMNSWASESKGSGGIICFGAILTIPAFLMACMHGLNHLVSKIGSPETMTLIGTITIVGAALLIHRFLAAK